MRTQNRTKINRANLVKLAHQEYIRLLLLHFGIAYLIYIFEPSATYILHGIILYFLFIIIDRKNKNNEALMAAAYISGAEVFFRMTDGIIFYETGKYMVIVFLLVGLFLRVLQ